jgi:hypothetical protein
MRPRKYPLDPLARLRDKQVGDATKLLADAIRAREEAQRVEAAAALRRDQAAEEARGLAEQEDGALVRGELRSQDLAHAAAWNVRVERERVALEERAVRASEGAERAEEREGTALDATARARAEAEVVARDRAKWEDRERKRRDAAEEETAAEAFRGKRT